MTDWAQVMGDRPLSGDRPNNKVTRQVVEPVTNQQSTKTDWGAVMGDLPITHENQTDLPEINQRSKRPDSSIFGDIKNAVTGEGKAELDLPEFSLPFNISNQSLTTRLLTDLGRMTTADPQKLSEVYKNHYPKIEFSKDSLGNIIADGREYGGNIGYLNSPGLSQADLVGFAGQAAAFTPATKAAQVASKIFPKMVATGAASGVTQGALDLTTQALSGKDLDISEVDGGDVALATVAGGTGEGLAQLMARASPVFKKIFTIADDEAPLTSSLRELYRREASRLGQNISDLSDEVLDSYIDATKLAINQKTPSGRNAQSIQAAKDSEEFGINFTKGQQSGDINQLSFEDSMRHGGPEKSREIMRQFDQGQEDQVLDATLRTKEKLGNNNISRISEGAETIKQGLQDSASALDDRIAESYSDVGDAFLGKDHVKELLGSVRRSVIGSEFDLTLKSTSQTLKDVKSLGRVLDKFKSIKPFHINKIEDFRRRLNGRIASAEDPTDRRQATIMKNAFDGFLDDAIDKALFLGDETAMTSLKKARGLRAEYGSKFQRTDTVKKGRKFKDEAGDVIERIIGADPSAGEVANYLFGANKLAKRGGEKIAKRIKTIFGEGSEEWQALRESAFLKLLKRETGTEKISGQVFGKRLNDALFGDSQGLMSALYTQEERALMMRLSRAIKRAQPARDNPSGSGHKVAQDSQRLLNTLSTKLGVGGAVLSNDPTVGIGIKAAGWAADKLKVFRKQGRVKDAIQGESRRIDTKTLVNPVAPSTAAALDVANPDREEP